MTFEASADNETALHRRYAISYSCVSSSIRFDAIAGFVEFYSDSWIISFSHHFGPRSLRLFWFAQHGTLRRGVHSFKTGPARPLSQRAVMSDKSPRQTMGKKSGKSLKEKRAVKRGKAAETSQTEALLVAKKR